MDLHAKIVSSADLDDRSINKQLIHLASIGLRARDIKLNVERGNQIIIERYGRVLSFLWGKDAFPVDELNGDGI